MIFCNKVEMNSSGTKLKSTKVQVLKFITYVHIMYSTTRNKIQNVKKSRL